MADIVCVGAHPDDVEIGMGGTIAGLARMGADVVVVDLTDGEPTPFGTRETRAAESAEAAAALGARRAMLGFENRSLADTAEARTALAEVLRAERPRLLFAPYPEDAHPDHIAASRITEAARFYAKFTKTSMAGEPHYPSRVYRYMAVHLRLVRQPSFIVDISADLPSKLAALRAYRSQFESNPANRGILASLESAAGWWGSRIGVAAGEPFFAIETLGVTDLRQLL